MRIDPTQLNFTKGEIVVARFGLIDNNTNDETEEKNSYRKRKRNFISKDFREDDFT